MTRSLTAAMLLAIGTFLSACSDTDSVPEGDPRQYFGTDLRGYKAPPGIMIGKDAAAFWPQAALAGFRETTSEDMPAKLTLVGSVGDCKFRKPLDGELVANVHVGGSQMATPLYVFTRRELAERTKNWIEVYKRLGDEAPIPSDTEGDRMRAVDVVVTETGKPVYLVLQSEGGGVLWNIHTAPDTKIAHVAVLSSGSVGVANLDESVSTQFMNQAVLPQCDIAPVREPAEYWQFVRNAKADGSAHFMEALEKNYGYHRAYSRWFKGSFGIGSETDVIGIDEASQVLVGPLPATPEARVPFKPLLGATLRIAREDYVMAGSRDEYRGRHMELVRTLAEKMAGGDLKSIHKGS